MRPMAAATCLLIAASGAGCGTEPTQPVSALVVEIVSPGAGDSVYDLDPILLYGTVTSPSVGILPDDSIWWTDNGDSAGYGPRVEMRARAGVHQFTLHGRYGPARDSAAISLDVLSDGLGRVLWTVPLSPAVSDGLTLLPDGRIAATEADHRIVVLSPDGSLVERFAFDWTLAQASVTALPDGDVVSGLFYGLGANAGPGGILRWRPGGATIWEFSIGYQGTQFHHVHGGVAVDAGGTTYFVSGERETPVWAVGPDGALRWRTEVQPDPPPVIAYETLGWTVLVGDSLAVVAMRRDSIVALSTATGQIRWIVGGGNRREYGRVLPAVDACGTVYVAGNDANLLPTLMAIDPDGGLRWQLSPAWGSNPVIGSTSRLYLGGLAISLDGTTQDTLAPLLVGAVTSLGAGDVLYMQAVDSLVSLTSAGERRFATPIPHSPYGGFEVAMGPVIGADGTVYVRTSEGAMAFRDTVGPSTDAPWPTSQGNFRRTGRVATGTCTR